MRLNKENKNEVLDAIALLKNLKSDSYASQWDDSSYERFRIELKHFEKIVEHIYEYQETKQELSDYKHGRIQSPYNTMGMIKLDAICDVLLNDSKPVVKEVLKKELIQKFKEDDQKVVDFVNNTTEKT